MQRPGRGTCAQRGIGCIRLRERLGATQQHDRIQRRVETRDAVQAVRDQRTRGQLAAADALGEFGGAEVVKGGVGVQERRPWIVCRNGQAQAGNPRLLPAFALRRDARTAPTSPTSCASIPRAH